MGGSAENAVESPLVYLDDRAVNLELEIVAFRAKLVDRREHFIHRGAIPGPRRDGESPLAEGGYHLGMRREAVAPLRARVVDYDVERPARDFGGVELLERARGCVSRIRERLPAERLFALVQLHEAVARHVDFAAHFERFRRVVRQGKRHGSYRPDVHGDVVADRSVAARRREDELPIFIPERYRNSVDLGLDGICEAVYLLPDEGVEVGKLPARMGLVQRLHRRRVRHLREAANALARNAVRGRGGIVELGMLAFEPEKLLVEKVVVPVADDGPRLDVIKPVVPVYLGAKERDPLASLFSRHAALTCLPA